MDRPPWRSPLLVAGVAVWVACLAAWGLAWSVSQDLAVAMGVTFGAFLLGGKLAAIPIGIGLHLPLSIIGFIILVPDAGAVLFAHPLTRGGIRVLGRLSRTVRRLHDNAVKAAERREGFVVRHGSLGIFAMALLPVGFYSPLVVSAIGQLMGLSAARVIIPVIAGMTIMTVVWVNVLGAGVNFAARFDRRIPFLIGFTLLFVSLAVDNLRRWRRRVRERQAAASALSEDAPAP